jgi:hypothetical protein
MNIKVIEVQITKNTLLLLWIILESSRHIVAGRGGRRSRGGDGCNTHGCGVT